MNCIDVSEWNGDINWPEVKAAGVDYAMIRCGFGHSGIDKYFNTLYQSLTFSIMAFFIIINSGITHFDRALQIAMPGLIMASDSLFLLLNKSSNHFHLMELIQNKISFYFN